MYNNTMYFLYFLDYSKKGGILLKKSKFLLLLVLTLVLSSFLAACGGSKDKDDSANKDSDVKQEITVLESQSIPSMDSVKATDNVSFTAMNNVMEGLYRLDQNQDPVPGVADGEPEVSEDGLVYTFKLKEEAKWSNGDPVTAHDFVYAWQRAIDPETGSEYGPYMMEGKIKGASEIIKAASEGKEYDLNTLGVKALDDKTLEVTLEVPIPYFQSLMSFPTFFPQNQKFIEEQGEDYGKTSDNLIFNGPFVLVDWEGSTDSEWTYVKNENYWDADTVKLEKVSWNVLKDPQAAANAFETGEADITSKLSSDIVPQYEGDERLVKWLEPTIFWIKMNEDNKALKNVNIRKAIAQAINKEDYVNSVLNNGSVVANYAVPDEFVKNTETGQDFREINGNELLPYNVEEAKKSWEKGLKELGVDKVELRYLTDDTETAKKTAEYIKNQLETNLQGLTITVESVPFSVRIERQRKQDYDLQLHGWGPDYLDPMTYSDLWVTGGGNNLMSYSNKKYDELIKAAQTTLATKPVERFEALAEAERILLEEDAAIAPLYQRSSNVLVSEKVKNFTYHLVGPELSFKWTYVE